MPAGTHSFTINSDDGVRLTIGNEVVIEQEWSGAFYWFDRAVHCG